LSAKQEQAVRPGKQHPHPINDAIQTATVLVIALDLS
jgi:hypothetical protein